MLTAEPALSPALLARGLLRGRESFDWFQRRYYQKLITWLVTMYQHEAGSHGWLRVPLPPPKALRDGLYRALGARLPFERAIPPKERRAQARFWAEQISKMWPALPYLVLTEWLLDEHPHASVSVEWEGTGAKNSKKPRIDRGRPPPSPRPTDLVMQLWDELAVLLVSQCPVTARSTLAELLRPYARAPWRRLPVDEVVQDALSTMAMKRSLERRYAPNGSAERAARYAQRALVNAVRDVSEPGKVPPSTVRRAKASGALPKVATAQEIQEYRSAAALRKQHRIREHKTGRQLATELGVSVQKVQRAVKVIADRERRPPPGGRGQPLRLDAVWEEEIKKLLGLNSSEVPQPLARISRKVGRGIHEVRAVARKLGISGDRVSQAQALDILVELAHRRASASE